MNVSKLSWTVFRLPLRAPFQTSAGRMTHREGVLLRMWTDTGIIGLGEASPHPAAAPGAAREVEEALAHIAPRLLGADVGCLDERLIDAPPALSCAIDTAACDALAKARGVSVGRLLCERPNTRVAVNATIAAEDDGEAASQAVAAREAGFRCVKLKVGMAGSVEDERDRVAAVRGAVGPDVRLRLDANGAWDVERAIATIEALEEFELELVEQPVPAGNLEGLRRVRRTVRAPIAADEAITSLAAAQCAIELEAADALVIKPMVVGGLRPARRIAQLARDAGVAVIVTTTIDAGVGTAAALHLAATLPPGGPACGLATGPLLADDIVASPFAARDGWMELPDAPGLGVELDEAKLAVYGGSEHEVA